MAHQSFAKIVEAAGVISRSLSSERSRPPPARHCGHSIPRALSGPVDYNAGNLLRGQRSPRPAKRSTSATVSSPPQEWKESVAAAEPTLPTDLQGLLFWLDAGRLSPHKGRIQQAEESGPASPAGACGWSIAILHSVSQRTVRVIFPYEQGDRTTARRTRSASVSSFQTGKCPLVGDSFSVCALIKPHIPREPHRRQGTYRRHAHPLRTMQTQSLFSNGTALFRHRGPFFAPTTDTVGSDRSSSSHPTPAVADDLFSTARRRRFAASHLRRRN
jgi:hypothetical protein